MTSEKQYHWGPVPLRGLDSVEVDDMSADKEEEACLLHLLQRQGEMFYRKKTYDNQKTLPEEASSSAEIKDMSVCKPRDQEIVA